MSGNFSSKLINYIEPITYNGTTKTVVYTEFGTNYKVNDKVFIINGYLDSNNLIQSDSFSKGANGYKILNIDRCKITLDIDYTGLTTSYKEDSIDNFIKLYSINSQREFDYINTLTINSYSTFSSKFEYGLSNNLIYAATAFSGTNSLIGTNSGVTFSGYYQKQTSTNNWISITSTFSNGSIFFNATYSLTNNNRLLILNKN